MRDRQRILGAALSQLRRFERQNHGTGMSLPAVVENPDLEELGPGSGNGGYIVTVYYNDYNTVF